MDQIVCIFCGQKADIQKQDSLSKAVCSYCNKETELSEYKKIVELWFASLK